MEKRSEDLSCKRKENKKKIKEKYAAIVVNIHTCMHRYIYTYLHTYKEFEMEKHDIALNITYTIIYNERSGTATTMYVHLLATKVRGLHCTPIIHLRLWDNTAELQSLDDETTLH